ncbi:MAG: hypothetical protein KGN84_18150 [Acidobacteriota bacterium]|nr:hypothetical protein [Acidobacteriota bacterium]
MTLDQLDQLLATWKSRSESVAAGLLELRATPSYEILTGGHDGQRLPLVGLSERRIAPALSLLEDAWRDYGAFSQTVQAAVALRQQLPRFSLSVRALQDIEQLLTGPTSVVAANGASLTLAQLHDRMMQAYTSGRAVLLEVDSAWKRLDEKLSAAAAFLRERPSEQAANVPDLRRLIEALRPRVITDPLGAALEFDTRIEPVFRDAALRIEKLERQRHTLPADLVETKHLLAGLAALCDENVALLAECRDKIAGFALAEQPVTKQRIADLGATLGQLEKRAEAGAVDPVCLDLETCRNEIERLVQIGIEIRKHNAAPLEMRRELRGRLSALKAKAHAKGVAEDVTLRELAERAGVALYAKPTPMNEATSLVRQYEARLNGRV